MIAAPSFFALVVITEDRACTFCRASQPLGLMGAITASGRSDQVLCDRCLYLHCEPLGLALQGIRMLRQAGAYRLGRAGAAGNLGDGLVQYAVLLDQKTRHAWPREHPLAKVDCEHCLGAAFPDLEKPESELLRAIFHAYQRLRFKLRNQDLFYLRHVEFAGYSDAMKTRAIERLESFMNSTDGDELCPRSSTTLHFLDEPTINLTDDIRFSLPASNTEISNFRAAQDRSQQEGFNS